MTLTSSCCAKLTWFGRIIIGYLCVIIGIQIMYLNALPLATDSSLAVISTSVDKLLATPGDTVMTAMDILVATSCNFSDMMVMGVKSFFCRMPAKSTHKKAISDVKIRARYQHSSSFYS